MIKLELVASMDTDLCITISQEGQMVEVHQWQLLTDMIKHVFDTAWSVAERVGNRSRVHHILLNRLPTLAEWRQVVGQLGVALEQNGVDVSMNDNYIVEALSEHSSELFSESVNNILETAKRLEDEAKSLVALAERMRQCQ